MKLFLLSRKGEIGYDEYRAQIIRADMIEEAREHLCIGDEGPGAWAEADVEIITPDGEPGSILTDFNAG